MRHYLYEKEVNQKKNLVKHLTKDSVHYFFSQ
jgi:hypothetical protein